MFAADASTLVVSSAWRKSSRSPNAAKCVEVANLPDGSIAIRHSKAPEGPALIFTEDEFNAFVEGAAALEFIN